MDEPLPVWLASIAFHTRIGLGRTLYGGNLFSV